jgi:hypothetical protein
MKFSIGDKAIEKKTIRAHTSYVVSEVVGTLDGALLLTHWGDGFDGEIRHYDFLDEDKPGTRGWREGIQRYQETELYTPAEAVEELHRLEAAKRDLDNAFEAIRDQIQTKMNQAAALVKDAGTLAKTYDREFFDLKQDCVALYRALEDGGWSHSHMSC